MARKAKSRSFRPGPRGAIPPRVSPAPSGLEVATKEGLTRVEELLAFLRDASRQVDRTQVPTRQLHLRIVEACRECFTVARPKGDLAAYLLCNLTQSLLVLGDVRQARLVLAESDRHRKDVPGCFNRLLDIMILIAEGREEEASRRHAEVAPHLLAEGWKETTLREDYFIFGNWDRAWRLSQSMPNQLTQQDAYPWCDDIALPAMRGRRFDHVLVNANVGGFGDQLNLLQLTLPLALQAKQITWSVAPELLRLAEKGLPAPHRAVAFIEDLPDPGAIDLALGRWQVPLLLQCRPTMAPVQPALAAVRSSLAPRLGSGPLRVAFNWRGDPRHFADASRSSPLKEWGILLQMPGVHWVTLQPEVSAEEELFLGRYPSVTISSRPRDFLETAERVAACDLLISVDSSSAHLGGIIGVPTWILLSRIGQDGRWLLGREDTPWYSSARLWRQRRAGDWADMIERIREALIEERDRKAVQHSEAA